MLSHLVTLYRPARPLDCLSGGEAPGTSSPSWCCLPWSMVDRSLYEEVSLYQGELIQRQSDHGDYVCSRGVAMSDGDGTDSTTRVSAIKWHYFLRTQLQWRLPGIGLWGGATTG
jgi:hypothetical protein